MADGKRGPPKGNQNAAKEHSWREAILRAMDIRGGGDRMKALNELAAALLDKAAEGDMAALKEIGDRLDGKAKQQVMLSGTEERARIAMSKGMSISELSQLESMLEKVAGSAAK